ncbi:MAG TPA: hypothetical protein VI997_08345 [Candidatus Thermoplasmatota archaeon]|nr:hypothetical protein [Candidatus Thermoplasmatota archaeon]
MDRLVALLVASMLTVTGAAFATHAQRADDDPSAWPASGDETSGPAHGGDGHALSASKDERLARAASGHVPTAADLPTLERFGTIAFGPDAPWTPAQGVVSGSGTADDPYLIEGVYADLLYVADTDVDFEVRDSWIGRLILDWHGDNGLVHHNRILAFEVNRNVERTGGPSAAVIAHNVIDEFTQLRHFDGVVAENVIGRSETNLVDRGVAFDIAGFNGAVIRDNLVFGGVDVKIHGHHHDDGMGGSHNHGTPDTAPSNAVQGETLQEDHAERHHRLLFEHNTIVDPLGFGLRYNDRNHAGDDRQATSEQEPALELPHTHRTHVAFVENTVDGAPFLVEIFMAKDELHRAPEGAVRSPSDPEGSLHRGGRGELVIERNRIVNATVKDGIFLTAVGDADVRLVGNVVEKPLAALGSGAGIRLVGFERSTIEVLDNRIDGFRRGVAGQAFDAETTWTVAGNRITGAEEDVWWDESVPNAPEGEASDGPHGHAAPAARTLNPAQDIDAPAASTFRP